MTLYRTPYFGKTPRPPKEKEKKSEVCYLSKTGLHQWMHVTSENTMECKYCFATRKDHE